MWQVLLHTTTVSVKDQDTGIGEKTDKLQQDIETLKSEHRRELDGMQMKLKMIFSKKLQQLWSHTHKSRN